jgi:hypothetical protein
MAHSFPPASSSSARAASPNVPPERQDGNANNNSNNSNNNAAFSFASTALPETSSFPPIPEVHVIASVHPENYTPPPPAWQLRFKNFLARSAANIFMIYPLRLVAPACGIYVLMKLRPFMEYIRRHTLRGP